MSSSAQPIAGFHFPSPIALLYGLWKGSHQLGKQDASIRKVILVINLTTKSNKQYQQNTERPISIITHTEGEVSSLLSSQAQTGYNCYNGRPVPVLGLGTASITWRTIGLCSVVPNLIFIVFNIFIERLFPQGPQVHHHALLSLDGCLHLKPVLVH